MQTRVLLPFVITVQTGLVQEDGSLVLEAPGTLNCPPTQQAVSALVYQVRNELGLPEMVPPFTGEGPALTLCDTAKDGDPYGVGDGDLTAWITVKSACPDNVREAFMEWWNSEGRRKSYAQAPHHCADAKTDEILAKPEGPTPVIPFEHAHQAAMLSPTGLTVGEIIR